MGGAQSNREGPETVKTVVGKRAGATVSEWARSDTEGSGRTRLGGEAVGNTVPNGNGGLMVGIVVVVAVVLAALAVIYLISRPRTH